MRLAVVTHKRGAERAEPRVKSPEQAARPWDPPEQATRLLGPGASRVAIGLP